MHFHLWRILYDLLFLHLGNLLSEEVLSLFRFFSPTAIALGSSAIVKVSGQNSFRTLYGFLRPICLGLPKGSAEGSTKVLQVSWCLWFSGAAPSWAAKRFRGRFHQGSAKDSPRFHQGSTKVPPRFSKFRGVSSSLGQIHPGSPGFVVSLALWGRSVLGCQKVPRKVEELRDASTLDLYP